MLITILTQDFPINFNLSGINANTYRYNGKEYRQKLRNKKKQNNYEILLFIMNYTRSDLLT